MENAKFYEEIKVAVIDEVSEVLKTWLPLPIFFYLLAAISLPSSNTHSTFATSAVKQ